MTTTTTFNVFSLSGRIFLKESFGKWEISSFLGKKKIDINRYLHDRKKI